MPFQDAIINAASTLNWQGNYGTLGTPPIPLMFGGALQFIAGAGALAGQARNLSGNTVAITSGTPVVIDLNTLTNPDGTACNFTDILYVGFLNSSQTPGEDLVIGGGTNPVISIWGSGNLTLLANPSGVAVFEIATAAATGYAINASTAHTFRLSVAAGTAVEISYVLLGH